MDALGLDGPLDAVGADAAVELHLLGFAVAAKDAGKAIAKRHDGTVENAVRTGNEIARNDGVAGRAPDYVAAAGRPLLPGEVGQRRASSTA